MYSFLGQIHLIIIQLQYKLTLAFNHINCLSIVEEPWQKCVLAVLNISKPSRPSPWGINDGWKWGLYLQQRKSNALKEWYKYQNKRILSGSGWLSFTYHLTTMFEPSLDTIYSLRGLVKNLPHCLVQWKGLSENIFPKKLNMMDFISCLIGYITT